MSLKNLVLSRAAGQSIVIGGSVVTVLETHRGQCRVSILADESVPVDRGEIHERKGGRIPVRTPRHQKTPVVTAATSAGLVAEYRTNEAGK